jgi:hypothetical protein
MKTQNLKAVGNSVNALENKLTGFRTEHYVGAHQAAQMAFREVIQQLCRHGWLARNDAESLLTEQDTQWQTQTLWNYTPLGDGTAQNAE